MSSVKQRSNSRVMQQKVDKARRLLEEVKNAIHIRNKVDHDLWKAVDTSITKSVIEMDKILYDLEAIQAYNKKLDNEKI